MPRCGGTRGVRNGRLRSGSPRLLCRGCGRWFVPDPTRGPVPDERKDLVRRPHRERVSVRGIPRATSLTRSWVQRFLTTVFRDQTPHDPGPLKKVGRPDPGSGRAVEPHRRQIDPGWVWEALDAGTRQVVAMVAGRRDERTARCRWDALPDEYRDRAVVATDFLAAYRPVVPGVRHAAAGKDAGITCHAERFGCTARQRVGRCVRKTLSYSTSLLNQVGTLWDFIRHYNASLL